MFDRVRDIILCETFDLRELANAAGADFRTFYVGADLSDVDLRGQDISEFDLTGANIDNAIIDNSTLLPINLDYTRKPDSGESAEDSELQPEILLISGRLLGGETSLLNEISSMDAQSIIRYIASGKTAGNEIIDKYLKDMHFSGGDSVAITIDIPSEALVYTDRIAFLDLSRNIMSWKNALGFIPSKLVYLSALFNAGLELKIAADKKYKTE